MPLTFSHPLAVVPLRRFFPAPVNFVALVVGSMTPDLGYYLHQFPLARFAHTAVGSFVVCLPSGLLGVGLFCLLQRPLCFMLPQPHRAVLAPLIRRQAGFSWRASLLTAACVLIGAWTHTAWDAFTHANGWAVERLAFLRAPLAQAGGTTFPVYYILQQASTIGGGLGLAVLYLRWLRRQPPTPVKEADRVSDRWRYALIGLLVAGALAMAVPSALRLAHHYEGYLAFRVFLFRTAVYATTAFVPLLVLVALGFYMACRREGDAG